jgi:hypothetical protein
MVHRANATIRFVIFSLLLSATDPAPTVGAHIERRKLQYRHHPLRVVLPLEPDDEVVGIPDQVCLASHSRADFALEP